MAGAKHTRPIVPAGWQESLVEEQPDQLVRGLLHSDGWRGVNRIVAGGKSYHYGRCQLSNRSADVARREAVAALDAFVERKD